MSEGVPWAGGCRIESDRFDANGIHQADREAVAREGIANETGAAGIRPRGKRVEDEGQRPVGIQSLRKIAGPLQICWQ